MAARLLPALLLLLLLLLPHPAAAIGRAASGAGDAPARAAPAAPPADDADRADAAAAAVQEAWADEATVLRALDETTPADAHAHLVRAIENGNGDLVHTLLQKGADAVDVHTKEPGEDWTALHLAVLAMPEHEDDSIVRSMLDAGANIHDADRGGWTALHWAAARGATGVVQLLLKHGADVGSRTLDGTTALHNAAGNGEASTVIALLDAGANLHAATDQDWTALHAASGNGHPKVVQLLLDKGADVHATTNSGSPPLHAACVGGHPRVVEILLAAGAELDAKESEGHLPLHIAAAEGHPVVVTTLLQAGAKATQLGVPGNDGHTPLSQAAQHGRAEVCRLLVEAGADVGRPSPGGFVPLLLAALAEGALHEATVRELLALGADATAASEEEKLTALHAAALSGQSGSVGPLVKAGADPNAFAGGGVTPLSVACAKGHADVAHALLEHGANLSLTTESGHPPLHAAAMGGHYDTVVTLLRHGANATTVDDLGVTALVPAAHAGHAKVVRLLLDEMSGYDKDTQGFPQQLAVALQFAEAQGHQDVAEILTQAQARAPVQELAEQWRTLMQKEMAERGGGEDGANDDMGVGGGSRATATAAAGATLAMFLEDNALGQYRDAFHRHGFDSLEDVLDESLTDSELRTVGLKMGHRKRFFRALKRLGDALRKGGEEMGGEL